MIKGIGAPAPHALDLLGLASLGVYGGLVAVGYATEGASYHFRLDPRNPFRSAERALVGIGVQAAGAGVRLARVALDDLFEASAEVGEWFTRRRSPSFQDRIRSRFL